MKGEFDFIEGLKDKFSIQSILEKGIGDDCAVIPKNDKESYVITTDALIEEIHFSFDFMTFKELGWKSIAVNLSDISAMGATPKYIFISIALPQERFNISHLEEYYEGVEEISNQYKVKLLGGDTTGSKGQFFLSVTAIGLAENTKVLYRNNAQVNDFIYVTGSIGDSSYGLSQLLENGSRKSLANTYFIDKHKKPQPKIEEMIYLNSRYTINSAIDISDGLSSDLNHIVKESSVGAIINWDELPVSEDLKDILQKLKSSHLLEKFVLDGGEDYEVLFTSPEGIDLNDFKSKFKTELSKIGRIDNSLKAYIKKNGQLKEIYPRGYDHFKKN